MKDNHLVLLFTIAILSLLYSCDDNRVYDTYVHTPTNGWEKTDFITYSVPKVETSGNYLMSLQMRTDNSFPFTSVTMVVDSKTLPSEQTSSDTILCRLVDKQGQTLGKGINLFQHLFPIKMLSLNKGDSLEIRVHHDMKREMLPGIDDVGLLLEKQ